MDYHQNARLTVHSREALARKVMEAGTTLKAAAAAFNVAPKTAAKWTERYRSEGIKGLRDRSCRPHKLRESIPPEVVQQVEALRRQRLNGPQIAQATGISGSSVSRILRRLGLNRIRDLEPVAPVRRYEHPHPGDLLHLDIKQLGNIARPSHRVTGDRRDSVRGIGWEYLHVAVDDHSRIAFCDMHPNQKQDSACAFLRAAIAWYAEIGIFFKAILTDNGPCYHSRSFARLCRQLGLKHRFTRPYTPRTNGKAERFIRIALHEWAYARVYQNSRQRSQELALWLHTYNWHRPHSSLGRVPPISRSGLARNNLLTLHT